MTQTIKIKTKTGKIIYRKAIVTDHTDGRSTAIVGRTMNHVSSRDFDGAVWSVYAETAFVPSVDSRQC